LKTIFIYIVDENTRIGESEMIKKNILIVAMLLICVSSLTGCSNYSTTEFGGTKETQINE
jgi:hypothetical protein